jgi:hypothetical protein
MFGYHDCTAARNKLVATMNSVQIPTYSRRLITHNLLLARDCS